MKEKSRVGDFVSLPSNDEIKHTVYGLLTSIHIFRFKPSRTMSYPDFTTFALFKTKNQLKNLSLLTKELKNILFYFIYLFAFSESFNCFGMTQE